MNKEEDKIVWGVLYDCGVEGIAALDKFENIASGEYVHRSITVQNIDGSEHSALTYVAGSHRVIAEGIPAKEYLQHLLSGAELFKLPEEYIRSIENLGKGRRG